MLDMQECWRKKNKQYRRENSIGLWKNINYRELLYLVIKRIKIMCKRDKRRSKLHGEEKEAIKHTKTKYKEKKSGTNTKKEIELKKKKLN